MVVENELQEKNSELQLKKSDLDGKIEEIMLEVALKEEQLNLL